MRKEYKSSDVIKSKKVHDENHGYTSMKKIKKKLNKIKIKGWK